MVFVKIGGFLAWLLFLAGLWKAGMGIFIASIAENMDHNEALSSRYLGSGTSGEHIDRGFERVVYGIVLGILVHIGRSIELIRMNVKSREAEAENES